MEVTQNFKDIINSTARGVTKRLTVVRDNLISNDFTDFTSEFEGDTTTFYIDIPVDMGQLYTASVEVKNISSYPLKVDFDGLDNVTIQPNERKNVELKGKPKSSTAKFSFIGQDLDMIGYKPSVKIGADRYNLFTDVIDLVDFEFSTVNETSFYEYTVPVIENELYKGSIEVKNISDKELTVQFGDLGTETIGINERRYIEVEGKPQSDTVTLSLSGENLDVIAYKPILYLEKEIYQFQDYFIDFKKSYEGDFFRTTMQQLELHLGGEHNLKGQEVKLELGVWEDFENIHPEWLDLGTFIVKEVEYSDNDDVTTIEAYDRLLDTHNEYRYEEFDLEYPQTLKSILERVCEIANLELGVTSFFNEDKVVTEDKWRNQGVTYRNVLDDIAGATGTQIYMKQDKLMVENWDKEVSATIDESNLKSLQLDETYGAVNMLNLSREPQHDNVIRPEDWTSIPKEERKEIVIANNQIMDKNREDYIDGLFTQIANLEYTPFEVDSFGYGYIGFGDKVIVKDKNNNMYTSYIMSSELTVSSGIEEKLSSHVTDNSKEEYALVTDVQREDYQIWSIVDKQNGLIEQGIIVNEEQNDKLSLIRQEIDEITATISNIDTTSNIIPNFNAYNEYKGWRWLDGNLKAVNGLIALEGLRQSTNFLRKKVESDAVYGLEFFTQGKAITSKGFVTGGEQYSYRGLVESGTSPFNVIVREYDSFDGAVTLETSHSISGGIGYHDFTMTLQSGTKYVDIVFDIPTTVTPTSTLTLTENIFNKGQPGQFQFQVAEFVNRTEAKISVLEDEVTTAVDQVAIIDGELVEQGSRIQQNANNINLKVDRNGVISAINLTPETAKIQANNIKLEGLVTANTNFQVALDGSIKAKNADITGKITATSGSFSGKVTTNNITATGGKVGGYTISGNSLVGNDVTLGTNEITLGNAVLKGSYIGSTDSLQVDINRLNIKSSSTSSTPWILLNGKPVIQGIGSTQNGIFDILVPSDANNSVGQSDNRYWKIFLKNQPNVSSDIRTKFNIQDIPNELIEEIIKVEPKMYSQYGDVHFGYIAQDVERAIYKYAVKRYGYENANLAIDKYAVLYKSESHLSLLYGEISVLKDKYYQDKFKQYDRSINQLEEELNGSRYKQIVTRSTKHSCSTSKRNLDIESRKSKVKRRR